MNYIVLDIVHELHLESTGKLKSLVACFNEQIKVSYD